MFRREKPKSLFHEPNNNSKSKHEAAEWMQNFNWQNPPANPNPGHIMRTRATMWNVVRQNQQLHDSARKFGMLPLASVSNTSKWNFHFIFTTTNESKINQYNSKVTVKGGFNWAHMRVVESVFYHHPSANIIIHTNTLPQSTFDVLTESGYKIQVQGYNLSEMIKDSPASDFTADRLADAMKGPHWYSHETDFLRTLIMYNHGGIYMDIDMVLVRPVDDLGPNVLAYQKPNDVNGAFMKFEKGNRFLYECLKLIPWIYNAKDWIVVGPGLLTKVWNVYKLRPVEEQPIQVMGINSFYMFNDQHLKNTCFSDTYGPKFIYHRTVLRTEAYAVHTNSKRTAIEISKNQLTKGTICQYLFNGFCVVCNTQY